MRILISGAAGFIGSSLCSRLSSDNKVIEVDITQRVDKSGDINWEQADLTDCNSVAAICKKHSPDVVIHCAGIAHQKIGALDSAIYMRVNSETTENFARAAIKCKPDVCFIFLSSISVYGEDNLQTPVLEENTCQPSSDYAVSKLDAERRLIALFDAGIIRNLIILRLAPVYDREWSFNLDRRIFAPKKMAYLKFGTGRQKMSALARSNLVEFIQFLLKRHSKNTGLEITNVCDSDPYEFREIIQVFKKSSVYPNRPIIPVPLPAIWLATRMAGLILKNKKKWIHSAYNKLSSSLVFDNAKMLKTGFKPRHSLQTVFSQKE